MTSNKQLPTGYYHVRKGNHWQVARWLPTTARFNPHTKKNEPGCWEISLNHRVEASYFDEVALKVA